MSISSVSDSSNAYQNRMSQLQSVSQDFSSLSSSLASGNLAAAQNAFATLMQDLGSAGAQSGQQTGAASVISTDLTTIGSALGSNDLTAAQKAYATLLQDLQGSSQTQKVHHHHHHHRHTGNTQNNADTLNDDLKSLGTALQSGDLSAAQKAYATLMQDIGTNSSQSTTTTDATGAPSATDGQSSATSSLVDTLRFATSLVQNVSGFPANTLLQALHLYGQQGHFNLSPTTNGLFSATG